MTNITSYLSNNQYHYRRAAAEGASGCNSADSVRRSAATSGASGTQNSSNVYNSSNVSGSEATSGASGTQNTNYMYSSSNASNVDYASGISYYELGTVKNLSKDDVVDLFTKGDLTTSEMEKWLNNKSITYTKHFVNEIYTYEFLYKGKEYKISCNSTAAKSQLDSLQAESYSESSLKNSYKFDQNTIEKYFYVSEQVDNKKPVYSPRPPYKTADEVKNAIFTDYKNQLIINNFLSGLYVRTTAAGQQTETASNLYKTENGKILTATNYTKYTDEIKLATDEEADNLRQEALQKLVKDFSSGNLAYEQVGTILNAIGVENKKAKSKDGNYEITFKFGGKDYLITCNKEAAKSGVDDIISNDFYTQYEKFCSSNANTYLKELLLGGGYSLNKEELSELILSLSKLTASDNISNSKSQWYAQCIQDAITILNSYDTIKIRREYSLEPELDSYAKAVVSLAGSLEDEHKASILNDLKTLLEKDNISENIGMIRYQLSLVISVAGELQIPEADIESLIKMNECLANNNINEYSNILEENYITDKLELLSQAVPEYDISDVMSWVMNDNDRNHQKAIEGVVSSLCNYDGSYTAMHTAVNIQEHCNELLEILNNNGYTEEDIYASDGLINNGTFTIFITAALMSNDRQEAWIEIEELLNSISKTDNKLNPFDTEEKLENYLETKKNNNEESIFDMFHSLYTTCFSEYGIRNDFIQNMSGISELVEKLSNNEEFNNQLEMKLRESNEPFSFDTFSNIFVDLYKDFNGENTEVDYALTYAVNLAYSSIMKDALHLDDKVTAEEITDSVNKYFVSNPNATYNDLFPTETLAKGRGETSANNTSAKPKKNIWSWVKENIGTIGNVVATALTIACPLAGLIVGAVSELYKSGCIDNFGLKTPFQFKNVVINLPQTLINVACYEMPLKIFGWETKASTSGIYSVLNKAMHPFRTSVEVEAGYQKTLNSYNKFVESIAQREGIHSVRSTLQSIIKSLYPAFYDPEIAQICKYIERNKKNPKKGMSEEEAIKRYGSRINNLKEKIGQYQSAQEILKNFKKYISESFIEYEDVSSAKDYWQKLLDEGKITQEEYDKAMEYIQQTEDWVNNIVSSDKVEKIDGIMNFDGEEDTTVLPTDKPIYVDNIPPNWNKNPAGGYDMTEQQKAIYDELLKQSSENPSICIGQEVRDVNSGEICGTCVDASVIGVIDDFINNQNEIGSSISVQNAVSFYTQLTRNGLSQEEAVIIMSAIEMDFGSQSGGELEFKIYIKTSDVNYADYLDLAFDKNRNDTWAAREAELAYAQTIAEFGDNSAWIQYQMEEEEAWRALNDAKHGW